MRHPGTSRARRSVAALLLLLAFASWSQEARDEWRLRAPAPVVALRPERLEGLEGYACASCHAETAREWAASAHGLAWVDEVYQSALQDKRRPQFCHGCHVPEPLLAQGDPPQRPKARDEARDQGVSCEACHLGEGGTILGPRGTPVEAHVSRQSEAMSAAGSIALCSACHGTNIGPVIGVAKDFEESDQAGRGRSCVGCHMAEVTRAFAAGDAPERTGRSHALQTPRDPTFLRRAFEVRWDESGVVIENRAGHRVPGLIGRVLSFRADLMDEAGAVVESVELEIDASAYLPVDGSRVLPLTREGHAVRLVGEHVEPRSDGPVVFLEESLSMERR